MPNFFGERSSLGDTFNALKWNRRLQLPNNKKASPLSRVMAEAPYLSRCSDNKTAAIIRPREYAARMPYMQVNRPGMVSWLIFDLDHSNPWIWQDEALPAPNIVVVNRNNGHAHLYYAIPPVCTTENARSQPIAYMKAVYEAMAARLRADPSYSGPVAKTPGHPWWSTLELHSEIYDLATLAEYVDLVVKPFWRKGPNLEAVSHSRHCLLFEDLRHYAYSIVNRERENGSFSTFNCLLDTYASSKNHFNTMRGFDQNLTRSQVKATVKSVARWTWDRYTGTKGCRRGVMALDKSLPLTERQQLAAKRTHSVRQKTTESKIRLAARGLEKRGVKPTLTALAKEAGLSRQTVAKYQVTPVGSKPPEAPADLPPSSLAIVRQIAVNYAVYQITARGEGLGPDDKEVVGAIDSS